MDTFLNYPFNPELFMFNWQNQPDPTKNALASSGVMVEDATIAAQVGGRNTSDTYTAPFYKPLTGAPANYDGDTDIPVETTSGDSMTGVVFGRTQGWSEDQFVRDAGPNINPFERQVIPGVAKFYQGEAQKNMIGILTAVSGVTGMESHVLDTKAPVTEFSFGDLATDALGDNSDVLNLAFMHSAVARSLYKKGLLEYAKYTDAQGIERVSRNIAYIDGFQVIVDDAAPHTAGSGSETPATYTTFLLGAGFLLHSDAFVEVPVEITRDALSKGGKNILVTRRRETIHPNGFSFTKPKNGYKNSPTFAQLSNKANWSLKYPAKAVPFAAITTQA